MAPGFDPAVDCTRTLVLVYTVLGISWITCFCRLFTRIKLLKAFGWDDGLVVVALVFFSCFAGVGTPLALLEGKDMKTWPEILSMINFMLLSEDFYVLVMLFLKITIGLFFLRIICIPWHRILINITIIISSIFNFCALIFVIFQCGIPSGGLEYITRRSEGRCMTKDAGLGISYVHGVIGTLTDLVYATLPYLLLRGSNMCTREKWTAVFILSLAAVGSIASIIRLTTLTGIWNFVSHEFVPAKRMIYCTIIEVGLGCIAVNLATLRPFYRWLFSITETRPLIKGESFLNVAAEKGKGDEEAQKDGNGQARQEVELDLAILHK